MRRRINSLLDRFLEERRTSDGGWAPVTRYDFTQLNAILRALIEAKWNADPDGDRPIDFLIVDRTRYRPIQYFPVPYDHDDAPKKETYETMNSLLTNLDMASREVRLFLKVHRDEE